MVTSQIKTQQRRCVHFWRVVAPQGELSWGECSKCGRRKRFSNRFDGRDRSNNSDIFTETRSSAFRPERRHTYFDPAVREGVSEGVQN
ncbi:MAG: hypothetical protein O6913_05560 [Chloroflexi bacterium]|nr:hypothetical protein [Chloroflexota bacterium]